MTNTDLFVLVTGTLIASIAAVLFALAIYAWMH